MPHYLLKRILTSLFTVFGVVTLVFFLVRLTGDPVMLYLPEKATLEQIEDLRQRLGMNRPLPIQYVEYVRRALFHLDFGESIRHRRSAMSLIADHTLATIELASVGLIIALLVSIPLGILSAVYRDSTLDAVTRLVALIGQSVPVFWLGIGLILIFAVRWHLLPSSGRGGLEHLLLPGLVLGTNTAGLLMRVLRGSMLDVLSDDYIRTAHAKGLAQIAVLLRHALKNAAIPFVTLLGIRIGYLLSGAVVTEFVFGYPGIGRLTLQAILTRDFPIVQAFVFITSVLVLSLNLIVDVIYVWLDPRIRYES